MTRSTLPPPPVISLDNTPLLDFRSAFPFKFSLLALILLFAALPSFAATITVGDDCSLRNAIRSANGETQHGTAFNSCAAGTAGAGAAGHDIINIPAGALIDLSPFFEDPENDNVHNAGVSIKSHVTINGNRRVISGGDRLIPITVAFNGSATINDLIITGGNGNTGGGLRISGGPVTLNRVIIRNNEAMTGGGIYSSHSRADVTINNSAIYNNKARNEGGGMLFDRASLVMNNVSIFNNTAGSSGGGIRLGLTGPSATYQLNHVTITRNRSTDVRGADGLYIERGVLTLRNSIISGNNGAECERSTSWGTNVHADSGGNIIGPGSSDCGAALEITDPMLAGATGSPPYFPLYVGSPAINAVSCLASVTEDQRGQSRPVGDLCDVGAYEGPGVPLPVSDEDDGEPWTPPPTARPRVSTCPLLPASIEVFGATAGTQCQQVGRDGIGNAAILAAGFRDGVDVWGWVLPDTRVCFRVAGGSFKFLDAATSPRAVSDLPAQSYMGMTCTTIDRAGTVALLPGPAAPAAPVMPTPIPSESLSGCMARAQYTLNLRDAPAGAVIGGVAYDATLTALSRTVGWFEVDNNGVTGWIAAMYVEPIGNCA